MPYPPIKFCFVFNKVLPSAREFNFGFPSQMSHEQVVVLCASSFLHMWVVDCPGEEALIPL